MEQESNQTGEVKEQPEATPEITSTEEKATSKARTEEEFRKLQSMKDKAEAEAKTKEKALESLRSEMDKIQTEMERQRLEARRREIDALEGDPDAQKRVISMHELDDRRKQLERDLENKQDALVRKYNQATELAAKHNVSITELLTAETPREMELMAQVKSQKASVEKEDFKPDSGVSDAGGDSDESFMRRYAEAKSDDHERARKIMAKL
jgi:hypothetical protein